MLRKTTLRWLFALSLLAAFLRPAVSSAAPPPAPPQQSGPVSAYELILAMNQLRVSYGLPALIEDPIINAVAQSTAEIMAANNMSWHIGDVRGRLEAAGYGGGAKVWGTENFAVGNFSLDEIMVIWSDASHMIPAVNPAYCHVGAGVAKTSSGRYYYVLQAAYTSSKACGEYKPAPGSTSGGGNAPVNPGVPQIIIPVKIATPDAEGKIYHEVKPGQSFWAIAIAYQITIKDIETYNNISRESKLQPGQLLYIPGENTEGYATPTPVGMVQVSTPDAEGKVIHSVQPYNTLITISEAYQVSVDRILALNGLSADWPLQIGQNLLIDPGWATPSPTPRPLTPIEMLTPASDGRYYHKILSGETLSGIAAYYDIPLSDLMAWNGLNSASIIQAGQDLVLQVTPPATETPTPGPATITPTPSTTPTLTPSPRPTQTAAAQAIAAQSVAPGGSGGIWFISLGLAAVGLVTALLFSRRKR